MHSAEPQNVPVEHPGEPVSGKGNTEAGPGVTFPIPEGARSVVITFDCTGGGSFTLDFSSVMMTNYAALGGNCDGSTDLAWPVSPQSTPPSPTNVGRFLRATVPS